MESPLTNAPEQLELPLKVRLESFEGPLDLLLYLIKKNEIEISDIPITVITQQYLEYLEMMKNLNLDIAGEFLLMAATLLHIKSKMLLPPQEGEEEGEENEEDPRAELVRRLMEYQRFKEAAMELSKGPLLDREVFVRNFFGEEIPGDTEEKDAGEASLFDLLEAMKRVLENLPAEEIQEISSDHLNIKDKILEIMERLWDVDTVLFTDLFRPTTPRREVILTFLAMLELMRLRMIRVFQAETFGTLRIFSPVEREEGRRTIEERIL
ncbi:MAG TPA: segregation/condensation protein A [Thermodesulfobacteriota bacterium]|nr:segregation/condensation protein A [Thermodesulfobacteriota bacterium]